MKNNPLVIQPPENAKPFGKLPPKEQFYEVTSPIIVYKRLNNDCILATLLLPIGTIIYSGRKTFDTNSRKMRASGAIVLSIYNMKKKEYMERGFSWRTNNFIYEVGDYVFPTGEFSMRKYTCDSGIHFFKTKKGKML